VRELGPRAFRRPNRFAPFVAALLLGLLCRTVSADEPIEQRLDALFGEHERYLAFFQELKDAVIRDDRKPPTIGIGHLLTRSERTSGKISIGGRALDYRNGITEQQCWDG
jgi:hypothetical protein